MADSPVEPKAESQAESKAEPKAKSKELGTLSIQIENDLFGSGDDRHYTNGVHLAWLSAANDV
ncbi:MAG: lipid A-modifier LpxR family protein, partial [Rhodospirillales bacterium]